MPTSVLFEGNLIKTIGEGLKPGSSAIIAVVEHTWVEKVEAALAEAQADPSSSEGEK